MMPKYRVLCGRRWEKSFSKCVQSTCSLAVAAKRAEIWVVIRPIDFPCSPHVLPLQRRMIFVGSVLKTSLPSMGGLGGYRAKDKPGARERRRWSKDCPGNWRKIVGLVALSVRCQCHISVRWQGRQGGLTGQFRAHSFLSIELFQQGSQDIEGFHFPGALREGEVLFMEYCSARAFCQY